MVYENTIIKIINIIRTWSMHNIKTKIEAAITKANETLASVIEEKNDTDPEDVQNVSLLEKKRKLF